MAWPLRLTEHNIVITFLSLFMLTFMLISAFITRRLFMGPAPVAFVVGITFGPKSAGLIDPLAWGNVNTVTLELSRIVLAVQCFGNAVELPKKYVERHWRSLALIIGPVMIGGWLITTCFVRFMMPSFNWRQSLACAACFNAIDPVLASTILDSGFGRRVPRHLRDLLRTEAAANGVTTTVLLNLAANLLVHPYDPKAATLTTITIGLAYGSIFSTVAGVAIGYVARRVLRFAERSDTIDRPSLLAFYLSVAMLSTGFGTLIGVDEVNLAFFAGIGLDNDDWYETKTEESFFSSAIDLMLNLSYFVFVGSLISWKSFNSTSLGTVPWRLVVGTICMFLFRRLPMMLLFKPWIPDVKTWREASFYGHFGPIGAGALFSGLTLRGLLTPGSRQEVENQASSNSTALFLDQVWAVVTFVVVCSSVVHGTSIALFSLGKEMNRLTITLSWTPDNNNTSSWMDQLPRIQGPAVAASVSSLDSLDISAAGLPPIGIPKLVLRRQKEEDSYLQIPSPTSGRKWDIQGDVSKNETRRTVVERGLVHAYKHENAVIVEDEDGNIIRKYTIPGSKRRLEMRGLHGTKFAPTESSVGPMSTAEFVEQWLSLDPHVDADEHAPEGSSVEQVRAVRLPCQSDPGLSQRRQELDTSYATNSLDETASATESGRQLDVADMIADKSNTNSDTEDAYLQVEPKGKSREVIEVTIERE